LLDRQPLGFRVRVMSVSNGDDSKQIGEVTSACRAISGHQRKQTTI
jgi:hypothetical protein